VTQAIEFLSRNPLLLLFLVVGLGYFAGSLRLFGFSLGPAAVLFVGLFFGALDSRLRIPDLVYVLGLVIFVYVIGLQSGPSFFSSFGRRSLKANLFAFASVAAAAAATVAGGRLIGLGGDSIVGVFCGSLTNTPALAASVEAVRSKLPAGGTALSLDAPVIAYGVSYPFGVIGVLLGFFLFGRMRAAGAGERSPRADAAADASVGPLAARTFRVVNRNVCGKRLSDLVSGEEERGYVLSRLRRGEVSSLIYADTVFEQGDLVVAVGDAAALERARALFGEVSVREIHVENQDFEVRRIEVSDKNVVGRTVADLHLQSLLDATITRLRRGDTDFVPSGDTVLERGDRARVITWAGNMDRVARFFGDSIRSSSETDFLSLSVGLALGVLLGMAPLPLPGGGVFALGFAGGPLVAGLVLGRLQRTGPIIWGMPFAVNQTLRQVGLVLFLAGIGTRAGDGLLATLGGGGWQMMVLGACVTALVTAGVLALGTRGLGLSYPAVMGLMSGIQTQPACLAYANERTPSNAPNVWYASVYPVSMIAKILLAQLMVWWLA
jgi:putative transport protein